MPDDMLLIQEIEPHGLLYNFTSNKKELFVLLVFPLRVLRLT